MSDLKVLMADDEIDVLQVMAKKVREAGYEVATARDGVEAWDKIQSENPDVIVLDLMMPQRDGYEILKELRENPPTTKWQPVIIVSAKNELEDMEKTFSMEADHYITKPCGVDDILKAIRQMVQLLPQHKTLTELQAQRLREKSQEQ